VVDDQVHRVEVAAARLLVRGVHAEAHLLVAVVVAADRDAHEPCVRAVRDAEQAGRVAVGKRAGHQRDGPRPEVGRG
jgi:hypothetical protein